MFGEQSFASAPPTLDLDSRPTESLHELPITTPRVLYLDAQYIADTIRQLNWHFSLGISEPDLLRIEQEVLSDLRPLDLLGKPVEEKTLRDAVPIWTLRVVQSVGREKYDTTTASYDRPYLLGAKAPEPDQPAARTGLPLGSMSTPTLGQFLNQVNGLIVARNESQLAEWLVLEPPFEPTYMQLIEELRRVYPKQQESALEDRCAQSLKAAQEGDQGSNWTAFTRFMVQYLAYLRDVSMETSAYLETYNLLRELQQKANSALQHPSLGNMMLQTVVTNARLVCRLAIGLDKQPELLAGLRMDGADEEGGFRETLPEKAANIIRNAFTTAMNDRTGSPGGLDADGKPEGKKRGIYTLANLCLKILFQCRKTRNATQIFEQISGNAPPLAAYPKSQRVSYLYYLGRFLFQHNHFYRAQLALQEAYNLSPAPDQFVKQRRLILVYLVTSNIILGRFPSNALLSRPEGRGLAEHFEPLCVAIRSGNVAAFNHITSIDSPHAAWFLHYRILFQVQNRCEVLVWRSLVRKTFLIEGVAAEAGTNKAASLDLPAIVAAFAHVTSNNELEPPDADFDGADLDFDEEAYLDEADDVAVESVLSSLIDQGFLRAYIAHKQKKMAILGAKFAGGNAVAAGFPNVWGVISKKDRDGGRVPGWKRGEGEGLGKSVGVFG